MMLAQPPISQKHQFLSRIPAFEQSPRIFYLQPNSLDDGSSYSISPSTETLMKNTFSNTIRLGARQQMHSILEEGTTLDVNSPELRASDPTLKARLRASPGQQSFCQQEDLMSSIQDLVLRPNLLHGDSLMHTQQSEFERFNASNNNDYN